MAGLVGSYNSIPRIRTGITDNIINPVGGSNPADLGFVDIANVRGQLKIDIRAGNDPNLFEASFQIVGGFGEYQDSPRRNWYVVSNSVVNCTVTQIIANRIEITTLASGFGGVDRRYIMEFNPLPSYPPKIRQVSVNIIGNNTLSVKTTQQTVVEGF